jgi:long-chain acyl-CoA synthetase
MHRPALTEPPAAAEAADPAADGFLHRFVGFARQHPDAIAIQALDEQRSVSYAALHELAQDRCAVLASQDLPPGERVLLCLPTSVELIAHYLATVGAGLVPVMINDKLTTAEFQALLHASAPAVLVTTASLAQRHQSAWSGFSPLKTLVTVDEAAPPMPAAHATSHVTCLSLPAQSLPPRALRLPEPDDVVTIQYTYKGLGEPLGVAHRYGALGLSARGLLQSMHPMGVGTVHLVGLPLYAVYGLLVLMVMPLSIGATLLLTTTLSRQDVVDVLARHQVAFACVVPELVRLINHQLGERQARGEAVPALHPQLMLYSGGSRLPIEVEDELARRLPGYRVLQGYGMTECLPVILQSYVSASKPGALGQAIPGALLRVVDEAGQDVPTGCMGELWIGGPTVTAGYLDNPRATQRFFVDGWIKSGDLVTQDEDGHVQFVGSRLRITKVRSLMVDLAEVERVACELPTVRAARAHAERDALGQTSISLSIVATTPEPAALQQHLVSRLSPHKQPRQIVVVQETLAAAA